MADGIVRIVLNAVDKYSGVLTGLNQGLELVSKAMGAVKIAGTAAFDAIGAGINLAAQGGAYREMKSQFDEVAATYKRNGDAILKSLNGISNGSLKMNDAVSLAGKAITTGLGGPSIEKVFTFVKRRTELTGESFQAMSEQVFNAIQSGRYSVLKQMGLVIQKGDGLQQILGKIEAATKGYGQAAFNAGDNIEALTAASSNFWTKIGLAINDTPLFQRAITAVTEAVTDFVDSFDTRQLSRFVEYFLQVGSVLLRAAKEAFGGVAKTIYESFATLGTSGVAQSFTKQVLAAFTAVAQAGSAVGKYVSNLVAVIASGWGKILNVVGIAVTTVETMVDDLSRYVAEKVLSLVRSIAGTFRDWVSASGDVASLLGIDKLSEGMNAAEDAAREMFKLAKEGGPEVGKQIGLGFLDAAESAEKFADSVSSDTFGDSFVEFTKKLADEVGKVKFPELSEINIKEPIRQVESLADNFRQAEKAAASIEKSTKGIKPTIDLSGLKGGKVQVDLTTKESKIEKDMKTFLAAVNWPAEFRAMGEYLLKFILSLARGERIPLTVSGVA
jgi:hypothetical protein